MKTNVNVRAQTQSEPAKVPAGDRPAGEELWQRYGAEHGVWTEAMLIALHEGRVKGNRWFSLIDKVSHQRTLEIAWSKVEANAGACGVDGVNIAHFSKNSRRRLLAVNEHLREGSYEPSAIKRVYIPKAGSTERRPLGIPTVRDRVVQGALKMVIEPVFEHDFAPNSYGFRPGRGCKDALREVERQLVAGSHHVVDVDTKGYFDAIGHEALMELVKERVSDTRVLGLIEAFLKQGVMEEGVETLPEAGSPQGGLISPLLANIYLNPFDWLMRELGIESVRYADDIVVLAASAEQAASVLEKIREWMAGAGLTLHPDKTRIVDMSEADAYFDFLGYRFKRSRKGKLLKLVRPQSEQKLRTEIRRITRRCNARSMKHIIGEINQILTGWYAYFKHANLHVLGHHDQWIRMRLRSVLRKRNRGKGRGRGNDHFKWPNRYFAELWLLNLQQAKVDEMSLQKRATC